jgi:hypothetical protein
LEVAVLIQKPATVVVKSGPANVVDGSEIDIQVATMLQTIADKSNEVVVGLASSVFTVVAIVADGVHWR